MPYTAKTSLHSSFYVSLSLNNTDSLLR